jgi:quercetin dioxygenase-like cupin family protein
MATELAQPGQVVSIRPLEEKLPAARTTTIAKTDRLEILRLVVHTGHEIKTHQAPGEIIVQCLEGDVTFTAFERVTRLRPGDLIYLPAKAPHSLKAKLESSLLVTIVFGERT